MARYAGMRLLEIWYDRTTSDDIEAELAEAGKAVDSRFTTKDARDRVQGLFAKARGKDQMKASGSLTETVDGKWRIRDDPPVVAHVDIPGGVGGLAQTFADYRSTLAQSRRELVERYQFVDFALKVVGVGSVGTRCFVALLEGRDEETRCSSRPRRRPHPSSIRTSKRATTTTMANGSSSASG